MIKRLAIVVIVLIVAVSSYVLVRANWPATFSIYVRTNGKPFPGFTLLAPTVDDIGAELDESNPVYLVDLDGKVVHSWRVLGALQLAKLDDEGNLFYITRDRSFTDRAGLRKIDAFGNVLWYFKARADHDFDFLPNGNILLNCIEDGQAPAIAPGKIRSPRLVEIDPRGNVVWEWRGEDHLDELTQLLGIGFPKDTSGGQHIVDGTYDWAHNNTCHTIDDNASGERDPRFRAGNILISYCNLNTIAIIDRTSGRIVWAWGPGTLDGQHNPTMLENGDIVLYDNGTRRAYSRILQIDPISGQIVWEYSDPAGGRRKFFSPATSGVYPLPNGNMLVCQSSYVAPTSFVRLYTAVRRHALKKQTGFSRLFEVTPAKGVVWEMVCSHNGPMQYGIYQAPQYSETYVKPLLDTVRSEEVQRRRQLKSLPYMR